MHEAHQCGRGEKRSQAGFTAGQPGREGDFTDVRDPRTSIGHLLQLLFPGPFTAVQDSLGTVKVAGRQDATKNGVSVASVVGDGRPSF
jgi:hypothetical protein